MRYHHSRQSHFVTFCCYRRRLLLTSNESRRIFEAGLERVRQKFKLQVHAYVVMPEHVHLLLSEPQWSTPGTAPLKPKHGLNGPPMLAETEPKTLADALKSLKQGVSRRLIGDAGHFWQKRYYDLNIRDYPQFVEKVRYIHRNPVKAGLCERPEDWEWSSFSPLRNRCGRTRRDRVRMGGSKTRTGGGETLPVYPTSPLMPKPVLSGPPADLGRTDGQQNKWKIRSRGVVNSVPHCANPSTFVPFAAGRNH
jgi:putative transposase